MSLTRRGRPPGVALASSHTPIVILGLAGLSMHHGALGAMRSAGRLGIAVFDVRRGGDSQIERSRYCSGSLWLPTGADEEHLLEAVCTFGREHYRAILLAVDDAGAMFVDDHAQELSDVFLLPSQPPGLARRLADKRTMYGLCQEHSIATPRSSFPTSETDVREQAGTTGFPVVLKRIDASHPVAPATPNVFVAHDSEELLAAYRSMESTLSPNVMLQEHIPGGPEADWMFNGYFDGESRCKASFVGRKLRQSPPGAGATTLGLCQSNHEVKQTSERFMTALGYRGPVDADYRLDRRDGRYKLLDVNPRIGASFRLFAADDGTDVLRAMYMDLTGEDARVVGQRDGRRWLVEPLDLRSSLIHARRGELTMREWLASMRGVEEGAWWARDDPLPFVFMFAGLLRDRLPGAPGAGRRFGAMEGEPR